MMWRETTQKGNKEGNNFKHGEVEGRGVLASKSAASSRLHPASKTKP
jgi:hypothetical protein